MGKTINETLTKKQIPIISIITATLLMLVAVGLVVLRIVSEKTVAGDTWQKHAAAKYSEGSGSMEDPYLIGTAEELALLAKEVNGGKNTEGVWYKLTVDVNVSDYPWMPIGVDKPFKGIFDGNGKTVYGMNLETKKNLGIYGLFGINEGIITDLLINQAHISLSYISSREKWQPKDNLYVGFIAGINKGEIVSGFVSGTSVIENAKMLYEGQAVGLNDGGTLTNIISKGSMTGLKSEPCAIGGIVGKACCASKLWASEYSGSIKLKNISKEYTDYSVGGAIGEIEGSEADISELIAYTTIRYYDTKKPETVGGFAGKASEPITIDKCICKTKLCKADKDGDFISFASDENIDFGNSAYYKAANKIKIGSAEKAVKLSKKKEVQTFFKEKFGFSLKGELKLDKKNYLRIRECYFLYKPELGASEAMIVTSEKGKKRLYVNGYFQREAKGLWDIDGKTIYFKKGQFEKSKTGIVAKEDTNYYVSEGVVDYGYNGQFDDGALIWEVKNGVAVSSISK